MKHRRKIVNLCFYLQYEINPDSFSCKGGGGNQGGYRRYKMTLPGKIHTMALAAIVLALAGCGGGDREAGGSHALTNISLSGSPNDTNAGPVDPSRAMIQAPLNGHAVVAGFRASGCGEAAPEFERMMRRQVDDGLRVPEGITLFDAGIGHYTSSTCGPNTKLRAIGAFANKRGTYEMRFFGGEVVRTLKVR